MWLVVRRLEQLRIFAKIDFDAKGPGSLAERLSQFPAPAVFPRPFQALKTPLIACFFREFFRTFK
jgi:hypothetical protein